MLSHSSFMSDEFLVYELSSTLQIASLLLTMIMAAR